MSAIIFGASGQDGIYLSQLLSDINIEVIQVSRSKSFNNTEVTDFSQVSTLIKEIQPDYIFHFAANSTTRHDAMFENHASISTGTLNILEAVRLYSPLSKVFISGSGLQFQNNDRPINELVPFEARDPYSVSRIQSVFAARYFRRLGVKVYVGYFFNHDSPLRTDRHMSKKIVEAAKRIAKGSQEKLEIGDLNVIKEWTFAGDVVKAVWTLINQETIFEVVIGSGNGYSIKDWVSLCFSHFNLNWENHVVLKDQFTSEYKQLISDPSLLMSMGWKPEVSFEELFNMMINS